MVKLMQKGERNLSFLSRIPFLVGVHSRKPMTLSLVQVEDQSDGGDGGAPHEGNLLYTSRVDIQLFRAAPVSYIILS